MPLSNETRDNEANRFKQSTSNPAQTGVVILNPDGSDVGVSSTAPPPVGSSLLHSANRLSSNGTTTVVNATAYLATISITIESAGTTSTLVIRDKSGTPKVLVNGLSTAAANTTPTILNFYTPILMAGGIDIILAGVASATVDVFLNYYQ